MKRRLQILLFALATPCFAIEDSPEARTEAANRYMEATPPGEMFADVATNMAKTMPENKRDAFIRLMTKNLDIEALTKAIKQSLIKHFTTDELNALATFYSSKEGKSAMKKMGIYMADLMPVIQSEIQKAMQKSQKEDEDTQ